MIVELAGLPGGGKTTICGLVATQHGGKGAVPLHGLRFDASLLRAAFHVFLLCVATRPFSLNRLKRGFNFVVFLRHYQDRTRSILLDQGQVQKLWSMVCDASHFSLARLHRVLAVLKPLAPDHLVWVEAPATVAAARLAGRDHGNSRYDGLATAEVDRQLSARGNLLRDIAEQYAMATGIALITLDGTEPPVANAERINSLLRPPPSGA